MVSIVFDRLQINSFRSSLTEQSGVVLSYKTHTYIAQSASFQKIPTVGCEMDALGERGRSLKHLDMPSMLPRLPLPRNCDAVSQPEKAWKKGRPLDFTSPRCSQIELIS